MRNWKNARDSGKNWRKLEKWNNSDYRSTRGKKWIQQKELGHLSLEKCMNSRDGARDPHVPSLEED